MTTDAILAQIDAEIARLQEVEAILAEAGSRDASSHRSRKNSKATAAPIKRKKRRLSPEGRARIAEAARRRWAAERAKAK